MNISDIKNALAEKIRGTFGRIEISDIEHHIVDHIEKLIHAIFDARQEKEGEGDASEAEAEE